LNRQQVVLGSEVGRSLSVGIESGAILLYLAERAGELGDVRRRTEVTRWMFAGLTTVEPPIAQIVLLDLQAKFGRRRGPIYVLVSASGRIAVSARSTAGSTGNASSPETISWWPTSR
jgi:glutathione S-transferase